MATPGPDGSFSLKDVRPGRYFLRAGSQPQGWALRDAMMNGRDIADDAFDISADKLGEVVVTFTSRPTEVVVAAYGSSGQPDPRAAVYVVASDQRYWTDYGWNPRRLRSARTDLEGNARILGLPPGSYLVAAVAADRDSELRSLIETIQFVSRQGQRVQLGDGEHIRLRLQATRGSR